MESSTQSFELMMQCFSPSALTDSCHAFTDYGSAAPTVIWSPYRRQFMHPLIERFADVCSGLCRTDGTLPASSVYPALFDTLADWLSIIRIDPHSEVHTIAHFGKGIADHYGRDMTGQSVSDFDRHIADFHLAIYQAARRRREWVLTEHEPPQKVFVGSWRRLVVPLVGDGGRVTGFITISIPENPLRAGLDLVPEPVFMVSEAGNIRFANAFACRLFGLRKSALQEIRFENLTGIALEPSNQPAEMFARSMVDSRVQRLHVTSGLEDDFLITISGAVHSGKAYYIVMLRALAANDATRPGERQSA